MCDCRAIEIICCSFPGAEDPLSTRRAWEDTQAEKKRLDSNTWASSVGFCLAHMTRVAQLVEREQRTSSKFDALHAAQQAQSRRIADLKKQMVRVQFLISRLPYACAHLLVTLGICSVVFVAHRATPAKFRQEGIVLPPPADLFLEGQ